MSFKATQFTLPEPDLIHAGVTVKLVKRNEHIKYVIVYNVDCLLCYNQSQARSSKHRNHRKWMEFICHKAITLDFGFTNNVPRDSLISLYVLLNV